MKIGFYMNCVSAHQLPLAKEVAELVGAERFRYIDAGEKSESAQSAEAQGLRFKVQRVESFKVSGFQGFNVAGTQGFKDDRRELARRKIDGWMDGVTTEAFETALLKLVEEKSADGAYRFKREEEKDLALSGARRFFGEFSRKIVELSDGRCVYFAPDARARERNGGDLARCWAEYAFHAVSSSGRMLPERNYQERWFNRDKMDSMDRIVPILRSEVCGAILLDSQRHKDAVAFLGESSDRRKRIQIITRVDYDGTAIHNLAEVTILLLNARKNTPPIKLLSEVVESVERHQGAGYLPSTTGNNISKACNAVNGGCEDAREWLETADVMLTGMRDLELFERRAKRGLRTYYTSERWFKPVEFKVQGLRFKVPGWVRMVVPGYRRMVKGFVKWANEDSGARVFAIGPWARRDFIRLGIRPEKLVPWGYFVASSTSKRLNSQTSKHLNILWCGRMLALKRVETIIRAVSQFKVQGSRFKVTLVGDGPEKSNLIRLAKRLFPSGAAIEHSNIPNNRTIVFVPSQPMEKVRELMRQHDLFVFPSNGYEGWGAVVSEALEEGMRVLGTFEAGASATLLPRERLFHTGDWKALAQLIEKDLRGELPLCSIGEWTAKAAAKRLMDV